MRLIKLDGEAPKGTVFLAQSPALGAVLAEAEVLETASRLGEDIWSPFVGMEVGIAGLMSGEGASMGDTGDEANSFVRPPFLLPKS